MMKKDFYAKGDQIESLLCEFGNSHEVPGFWCNRNPRWFVDDCLKGCPRYFICASRYPDNKKPDRNWMWEKGFFDWGLMAMLDPHQGEFLSSIKARN